MYICTYIFKTFWTMKDIKLKYQEHIQNNTYK